MIQDPEHRYAPIIFLAFFVCMLVLIAMFVMLGWMVMMQEAESLNATRQQCINMYFGDNSETGYVDELAGRCWEMLK